MADFDFNGLEQAIKEFQKLEDGKKLALRSMRKGAKKFQSAAKANAPVLTGAVQAAIKVKNIRSSSVGFGVKVEIGKKDFVGDTFYGAFQEYGWKTGSRNDPADKRKQIPGKGFMRRAFDENKDAVLALILEDMKTQILKRNNAQ